MKESYRFVYESLFGGIANHFHLGDATSSSSKATSRGRSRLLKQLRHSLAPTVPLWISRLHIEESVPKNISSWEARELFTVAWYPGLSVATAPCTERATGSTAELDVFSSASRHPLDLLSVPFSKRHPSRRRGTHEHQTALGAVRVRIIGYASVIRRVSYASSTLHQ